MAIGLHAYFAIARTWCNQATTPILGARARVGKPTILVHEAQDEKESGICQAYILKRIRHQAIHLIRARRKVDHDQKIEKIHYHIKALRGHNIELKNDVNSTVDPLFSSKIMAKPFLLGS